MGLNIPRAGFFIIATLCLVVGVISARHLLAALAEKPLVLSTMQLLPHPKPLPKVLLRTAQGDAFARERFRQHWSLVFFGFTSCPDFCPLELQKLSTLLAFARDAGKELQIVFVSVDPERDSAEQLARYVGFFHPQIIGLRGDNPAIANFARFFGASYDRSAVINNRLLNVPAGAAMPDVAGDQYQVNHSTRVFLVDPLGQYVGSAANIESAQILWSDLQKLF